jgi:hypothetical protein
MLSILEKIEKKIKDPDDSLSKYMMVENQTDVIVLYFCIRCQSVHGYGGFV